ncbi:hypothetical protein TNCT_52801 [Trichonephila clavata]|uniref:Uncharacterized protein n=1 Tax=Trichonephila clavata TaxID=2740835 RepID=A0A8X6M696_TRICU|nr:hypothetical protein TNCT_52801 [Trichonephila clavata]
MRTSGRQVGRKQRLYVNRALLADNNEYCEQLHTKNRSDSIHCENTQRASVFHPLIENRGKDQAFNYPANIQLWSGSMNLCALVVSHSEFEDLFTSKRGSSTT